MKMIITVFALVYLAGLAWIVAPKTENDVFGRTMRPCPPFCTWDGKVSVVQRSDADYR